MFLSLLQKHRLAALCLIALLLGLSIYALPQLRFDFSIGPLLEGNGDQKQALEAFQEAVPSRRVDLICAVEWREPITGSELSQLGQLSKGLLALNQVASVFSLAEAPVVQSRAGLPVQVLFRDLVGDGSALEQARSHPLFLGSLLSEDGRSAAIYVGMPPSQDVAVHELGRAAVQQFLADHAVHTVQGARVRLLGGPVVQHAITTLMSRDVVQGVALEALLFALLLPLLFRTVRGTLIPLLTILSAVCLCSGMLVLLGLHISIIDLAVPGLIMIIGLCDAVHMLERFEEALREGLSKPASLVRMMSKVGPACLYTSITTGLGFASLAASSHPSVRAFGLKAALAVLVTFATVITLLPICLSFWPVTGAVRKPALPWVRHLSYGRPRITLLLFGALTLVSLLGASRVKVNSHWLEELSDEEPAVVDLHWFEQHFRPLLTLDVDLRGSLDSPEGFRALERLRVELLAEEEIAGCESYHDWIREVMNATGTISDQQITAGAGLLKLAGDRFPTHVATRDFRQGRMSFNIGDVGSERVFELIAKVDQLATLLPAGVTADVVGYMSMAHESSKSVVVTILRSFLLSLLAISLFIMLIYRSPRIGLISILPNLLPILVTLGLNGWLGIDLRIGIVMIYSVGLGLAVDDSIHLLTRYVQERADQPALGVRDCLLRSLKGTGRALIITSLILMIGGLCYLPSDFQSLKDIGLLLSVLIMTALLADLFLLPLLIQWTSRSKET